MMGKKSCFLAIFWTSFLRFSFQIDYLLLGTFTIDCWTWLKPFVIDYVYLVPFNTESKLIAIEWCVLALTDLVYPDASMLSVVWDNRNESIKHLPYEFHTEYLLFLYLKQKLMYVFWRSTTFDICRVSVWSVFGGPTKTTLEVSFNKIYKEDFFWQKMDQVGSLHMGSECLAFETCSPHMHGRILNKHFEALLID